MKHLKFIVWAEERVEPLANHNAFDHQKHAAVAKNHRIVGGRQKRYVRQLKKSMTE